MPQPEKYEHTIVFCLYVVDAWAQ